MSSSSLWGEVAAIVAQEPGLLRAPGIGSQRVRHLRPALGRQAGAEKIEPECRSESRARRPAPRRRRGREARAAVAADDAENPAPASPLPALI